jgi:tetratricopeptide (TPR) repeat protein
MMTPILDPISFSKNCKDDAQRARKKGNFDEAESIMADGIKLLERSMDDLRDEARSGEHAQKIAEALSDAHGALGGIRRSAGLFERSADAYDAGYLLESDPDFGVVNSYNLTQRLVARVLLEASSLGRGTATVRDVDFPVALEAAERVVGTQIKGTRSNDPWAQADRAMLLMLLGRADDERAAWKRLLDMQPPGYVYSSTLNVLRDLNGRVREAADLAQANSPLHEYVRRLTDAMNLLKAAEERAAKQETSR